MIKYILYLWPFLVSLNSLAQKDSLKTDIPVKINKSQKTVQKKIRYPHLYWGFDGGAGTYGMTLKNDSISFKKDLSYGGGIFFELRFVKWFGLEVGGTYSMTSSEINLKSYSASFTATDNEGDQYEHRISAVTVKETDNLSLIQIPVSFKFVLSPGKWNFYLKPGAEYIRTINSTYSQNGIFSVSGYYSQWNVLIQNLPEHGFYFNKFITSNNKLKIKESINPFIAAGIVFPAKSGNFFMEGRYYPGQIDFAQKGNGSLFEGPMTYSKPSQYTNESVTEEMGKVYFEGYFITIGFRF